MEFAQPRNLARRMDSLDDCRVARRFGLTHKRTLWPPALWPPIRSEPCRLT